MSSLAMEQAHTSHLLIKDYWRGAERSPWGSVYKGAVRMARGSECQSIRDRLTDIALESADGVEQALLRRTLL